MTAKPKRRRFQFGLRTLLVFMTLVCTAAAVFALFARSRHFQEQAAFHRSQVQKYKTPYRPGRRSIYQNNEYLLNANDRKSRAHAEHFFATMRFHEQAADAFDRVARQPWRNPLIPSAPPEEKFAPNAKTPQPWHEIEDLILPDSPAPAPNQPKN
jgi:hypothetical protein